MGADLAIAWDASTAELSSMHCLLCHEKIPRLRAWTGKSEFCSDEHAELYKKQTMDRLLVDDSQPKGASPALPIMGNGASSVDHVLLKSQPTKSKLANHDQEAGDVDELWKLAERMGGGVEAASEELRLPAASSESQGDTHAQSAEEALAALQALAAEAQSSPTDGDLLDEFSRMESSLEGLPQLESLPTEPAAASSYDEVAEAPELELDALEAPESLAEVSTAQDSIDVPDLQLEGLAEAEQEALEPPELAVDFDDAEQADSLEPSDAALEELLAASEASTEQSYELSDPPEPADFELIASQEATITKPAVATTPRRAPKATPKLRPATDLQEMNPSPSFPDSAYALKPWTDALAIAGPDRASLFSPAKFSEIRKSSLNGTASAKFDPVLFRASESLAAVGVSITEPKEAAAPYSKQEDALTPRTELAWPAPLHAALTAGEMRLNGRAEGIFAVEPTFSAKSPALSAEFLSNVALQSRVLEPQCSAILSLQERDVFASAAAEEEESGSAAASAAVGSSDRDETDGGERAHVADLF